MKQSFQAGGRAAFETTGGRLGDATSAASTAASSSTTADGPPDWAKRMKRSQRFSHGVQAAANAVRSGDSHGGASSVNLSEGNRS
jgi:type IV secretion system protein TrbL